MSGYLLDTVICSRLRRADPAVVSRMASLPEETAIYLSVITVGELLKGIHLAPANRREKLMQQTEELVDKFPLLDVTLAVAEKYGEIVSKVPPGQHIGQNDYWIASTAMSHDLVLVSSDPDFDRVDGLRKENWLRSV